MKIVLPTSAFVPTVRLAVLNYGDSFRYTTDPETRILVKAYQLNDFSCMLALDLSGGQIYQVNPDEYVVPIRAEVRILPNA